MLGPNARTRTRGGWGRRGRSEGRLSGLASLKGTTRTRTCIARGLWEAIRLATRTRSCPRRRRRATGRMRGGARGTRPVRNVQAEETKGTPRARARYGVFYSRPTRWLPPSGTNPRPSRSRSARFTCFHRARNHRRSGGTRPRRSRRTCRGRRRRRRRCPHRRMPSAPNLSTRRPCSWLKTDPRSSKWRGRGNAGTRSSASSTAAPTRGTTGTSWASAGGSWARVPGR
mmetsp:Transcript_7953/g.36240  ORF Transcript_7953/g.36240 Transcript_7953/m.36240 type:complete len:228 (+) Transcript_7953:846-1529(+)